ncbi:hypothetical protein FDP41_004479 [Naegleria fowleri]|uniref:Transcription elongation factor 1 homolog n=1 Tax=Naegleria fowleri TaxID=5763 RepID=A0A6A5BRY8_NAEFO|nr:uncharacterized protein FDP41_004479 [Naegleria fowleri]KAF0976580.1 hypothetical protein FDP41_004479 [Naegleria fowleri]
MGKRKTRKPPPKKVQPKLPTSFDCPFCNHEGTVECVIDRKQSTGKLTCRICGAQYQTNITYIMSAIDVYSEWIDECEKVNSANYNEEEEEDTLNQPTQEQVNYHQQQQPHHRLSHHQQQQHEEDEEDEDDGSGGPTQGLHHQYHSGMYHRGVGGY